MLQALWNCMQVKSPTCNAGDLVPQFGYHARLIGTVAQLVEQGPFKALVLGSSPSRPTIKSTTCAYKRPVCTEIVRKNFCDHETLARGVRPRPVRSLAALYR